MMGPGHDDMKLIVWSSFKALLKFGARCFLSGVVVGVVIVVVLAALAGWTP